MYNSASLDLFICLKKPASCHLHFTHTHIYEYQLYAYKTCCIVKLITVCENQDLHKNYPNIRDSGVIFLQSFQLFDLSDFIICVCPLFLILVWSYLLLLCQVKNDQACTIITNGCFCHILYVSVIMLMTSVAVWHC